MKILRGHLQGSPLFLPLIAVIGAIPGGWWYVVSAMAVLLVVMCRLWRIGICTLLCSLVAGLYSTLLEQRADDFRALVEWQEVVELHGTVERSLRRGCVVNTGWSGVRVVLRGNTPYTPGDVVWARAVRQDPQPDVLPGVFDTEAWMRGQGIAASLDYIEGEKLGKPLSLRTVQHWGLRLRERLAARFMPPGTESDPARQVLCSLVLGDKSGAAEETIDAFRHGGCLHVFAVSGLHVGLVATIFWMLFRLLRVRPVVIRPLLLAMVGVYVLITGCAVPALRAYLMLAVLLLGYVLRQRVSLLNTWSFAALLILLVDPSQLRNAGFLLSFGIYATICLAVHLIMSEKAWFGPDAYIPVSLRTPWEMRWSNIEVYVRGTVIVALSAWLVSLPITLCFFHSTNTSSFLTNIAIALLLPVVMLFGMLHLCLGSLLTGWAAQQSAAWLLAVVTWFGELPYAYLPAQEPAPLHSLLVQGTKFGGSFTMLGNHGLLIDCGNETTAEMKTMPTLFHAGYTPAVLLVTSPGTKSGSGAEVLNRMWPQLPVIRAHELSPEGLSFETQSGRFSIFPPPVEFSRRNAESHHPIVLWEYPGGSLLYVGNAAYQAYAALPQKLTRCNWAVLGRNQQFPLPAEAIDAEQIIALPNASVEASDSRVVPVPVEDYLQLMNLHGQ